jgi:protein-serine/threonine kinase
LIKQLLRNKDERLCSPCYAANDIATIRGPVTSSGRYVFPHDAKDIKAHRWFKGIPWDKLHLITPPFVPQIKSLEDTRYFEEDEPISDWSGSSISNIYEPLTFHQVQAILHEYSDYVQAVAMELVTTPHDALKLRQIHEAIDSDIHLLSTEKDVLKDFVRLYGRKERKRPRDRLLRDPQIKSTVLDVRRKTAFLGYTWRRVRPHGYTCYDLLSYGNNASSQHLLGSASDLSGIFGPPL